MNDRKHLFQGYLAALATLLIWSGFALVSRLGGKSALTPWDIYALRLVTAAIVLIPFVNRLPRGAWRDGRLWLLTALSSLIYCPLSYSGFKYAPAAHGGILMAGMQPLLTSIVIFFLYHRPPGKIRAFGLLFTTLGIVCAAVPYFSEWSPTTAYGDFLIFLSSICWALYSVLAARWRYPPWALTVAIVFGSFVVFMPIYLLFLPKALAVAPLSAILTQSIFQGVFATIVAMLTYLKALAILGTERALPLLATVPIVVGLVAIPLLDEPLTGWLLTGLMLVSLGAIVAAKQRPAP